MSSIGSEVINGLEDAIFGSVPNETITSTPDPFEEFDPFADDAFFYPRVIHDSEPCKWLIQHKISHINIRLWDLLFFVPNSTFLSFLMFGYSKSKQRLKGITGNSNGLIVLYYLVVIMTASCVTRSLINMLLTMEAESSTSEKVGWVFTKFVYLAAEVCIIIITSCFGWIGKNGIYISLIIGTVISLVVCSIQLYLEINVPYYGYKVIHTGVDLYGHGGPAYHCVLSAIFTVTYLLVMLLPCLPKNKVRIQVTAAYYCYCIPQFILNLITFLGALLVAVNKHGGLCMTDFTSFLYFSVTPVLVYLCFIRQNISFKTPNFLFAYSAQVDENQDEGMFIHSDSLNSFDQATATSIIKQECTHLASTTLSPGLQSPEPIEDRDLLIP